jgi:hypothetical protein
MAGATQTLCDLYEGRQCGTFDDYRGARPRAAHQRTNCNSTELYQLSSGKCSTAVSIVGMHVDLCLLAVACMPVRRGFSMLLGILKVFPT